MVLPLLLIALAAHGLQVTHHLTLPNALLTGYGFTRDGSMVGSFGNMGPHDGFQIPLIVKGGKMLKFQFDDPSQSYEVLQVLPSGGFLLGRDGGQNVRAVLHKGRLIIVGKSDQPLATSTGLAEQQAPLTPEVNRLFPVPEDKSDTTNVNALYWWPKIPAGGLGEIQFEWNMESGYRSVLRDARGHLRRLAEAVPGLRGYEARRIWYVSPQGWFVVDAVRRGRGERDDMNVGGGNELFWVESSTARHRRNAN